MTILMYKIDSTQITKMTQQSFDLVKLSKLFVATMTNFYLIHDFDQTNILWESHNEI